MLGAPQRSAQAYMAGGDSENQRPEMEVMDPMDPMDVDEAGEVGDAMQTMQAGMAGLLKSFLREKEEVQFVALSHETTWRIGSRLVEVARREKLGEG